MNEMTSRRFARGGKIETGDVKTVVAEEPCVSRVKQMLDSCRDDAAAQLNVIREVAAEADAEDINSIAIIAMAAENAAKSVERLYKLSIIGGGYELARPPQ